MGDRGSATLDDDRPTDELEARRPGAVPSDPKRWTILAVPCLALLIVGIDGTIVNVASPTLVRDIGASSSELQWIVDAYTIIFASTLLIAGNSDVAGATLDLLAEAGFSSLTFSGIATRSGVSTNNLDRYWTSRVDAVVDAVNAVFEEHPLEDSGDIVRDLHGYAESLRDVIDTPKGRAVFASLISAAANDPDLDTELRRRLVEPRRNQLVGRIERAVVAGQLPPEADAQWIADAISGPIWLRALVTRDPLDAEYIDHLVDDAARVMAQP